MPAVGRCRWARVCLHAGEASAAYGRAPLPLVCQHAGMHAGTPARTRTVDTSHIRRREKKRRTGAWGNCQIRHRITNVPPRDCAQDLREPSKPLRSRSSRGHQFRGRAAAALLPSETEAVHPVSVLLGHGRALRFDGSVRRIGGSSRRNPRTGAPQHKVPGGRAGGRPGAAATLPCMRARAADSSARGSRLLRACGP